MRHRPLALLALALAVGCDRRPSALDRDDVTLHPGAGRVRAMLAAAADAAAHGDTATVHARLSDAEAAADEDATLVFQVASAGDRLGDGPNAAMDYTHYLVLDPDGPHARVAEQRREALTVAGIDPTTARAAVASPRPSAARATSPAPVPLHAVAALPVATRHVARRVPRTTASHASGRRVPRVRAERIGAEPVADRNGVVATRVADAGMIGGDEVLPATSTPATAEAAAPARATRSTSARRGRLAAIGAATGAVMGAIIGRGVTSTVAGAVVGGTAGAVAGSRPLASRSSGW